MKHAIVVGHPDPASFNLSIAHAYKDAVERLGHQALLRDLYRLEFDPTLHDGEIPRASGFSPLEDVKAERALIGDADVFVFIYPLWFNMPPAILTGYIQRVFSMGFGFGPIHGGGNQPLLEGRKMLSFSTSGAPSEWLQKQGSWLAIRTLFDEHLAGVCGLTVIEHKHFGQVLKQSPRSALQPYLDEVAVLAERLFPPATRVGS